MASRAGGGPPPPPPPPAAGGAVRQVERSTIDKLADMQRKLNKRMLGKASKSKQRAEEDANANAGLGNGAGGPVLDLKTKQWVALQSRSRKMGEAEFLALVALKQAEVGSLVERVLAFKAEGGPGLEALVALAGEVSEASNWFPGGSKELKSKYSEDWPQVERKVEAMNLLVAMTEDMRAITASDTAPDPSAACAHAHADKERSQPTLLRAREGMEGRKRIWGDLKGSLAMFSAAGLPVDAHVVSAAKHKVMATSAEACEALAETLVAAHAIAPSSPSTSPSLDADAGAGAKKPGAAGKEGKRIGEGREELLAGMRLLLDTSEFLEDAALLRGRALPAALALVHADCQLLSALYGAPLLAQPRQAVQSAFDGSLKMLKQLEKLGKSCAGGRGRDPAVAEWEQAVRESIGAVLVKMTEKLLGHILKCFSEQEEKGGKGSEKDMVAWLVFGCQFINRVLSMVGDVEEESVKGLLASFLALENKICK